MTIEKAKTSANALSGTFGFLPSGILKNAAKMEFRADLERKQLHFRLRLPRGA
jgi:hypothetical protein